MSENDLALAEAAERRQVILMAALEAMVQETRGLRGDLRRVKNRQRSDMKALTLEMAKGNRRLAAMFGALTLALLASPFLATPAAKLLIEALLKKVMG